MKQTFKKRLKKGVFYLILLFIILFVFRIIYGYTEYPNNNIQESDLFFQEITSTRVNYASKKYKINTVSNNAPAVIDVDQKYEKIATVNTKSSEFEREKEILDKEIKRQGAIIQFEQNSGNKGYRRLQLLIGVQPEKFESLYDSLSKIGKVQSKEITKKDKTNEYKQLNAKKESLLKIRTSLIELKSKGGKIEEYINLENRILSIEEELQGLGVQLGNYDEENEFCTIKFSLIEGTENKIGLMHRIKVALGWTVSTYLQLIVILFFIAGFVYLALLILDKLNLFNSIIKNLKD
ncbi:DUF4349 domain-containing protein [Flavivirga spongiicola]|uniref:DUF4349 domain-containing protein n=1 Tax=Flavivirga spongiicola TaxID=421621 RepID=A0ABU7XUN6_9FLAO|nr:DUF4349 domain-containing protein [Flavivirga sp. MEBiC05379]MDO5979467.1 DUF4349 domain-containing protein [Flavivirga sp. MEBiC05379]